MRRTHVIWLACGLAALVVAVVPSLVGAEEIMGTIKSIDVPVGRLVLTPELGHQDVMVRVNEATGCCRARARSRSRISRR